MTKAKDPEERAEDMFDAVSDWFATELPKAIGDDGREKALCLEAVKRYAEAKRLVDPEGAFENVTHFFGADGIGFERRRTPALSRVKSLEKKDGQRVAQLLGSIAMRLESESLSR
jgi:hypothetical protein